VAIEGVFLGGWCKGWLLGEISGGDKVNRDHAAHRYSIYMVLIRCELERVDWFLGGFAVLLHLQNSKLKSI